MTRMILALCAMLTATRLRMRPLWLAGAGLMAVVVIKLFFVDLSNVGGIERIVSFIGVGVLQGELIQRASAARTDVDRRLIDHEHAQTRHLGHLRPQRRNDVVDVHRSRVRAPCAGVRHKCTWSLAGDPSTPPRAPARSRPPPKGLKISR